MLAELIETANPPPCCDIGRKSRLTVWQVRGLVGRVEQHVGAILGGESRPRGVFTLERKWELYQMCQVLIDCTKVPAIERKRT